MLLSIMSHPNRTHLQLHEAAVPALLIAGSNSPIPQDFRASEASIVLIGIRGTGKSSLAIMASSALGYRVIDADQQFFTLTGRSRAAFNAEYGVEEYKRRELQIMRSILLENQSRCVITCGPGSVEDKGQGLLREYAKTHPVIYILRDVSDIQRYLRAWDTKTISDLIDLTAPSYRTSSSFEFYNISESRKSSSGLSPEETPSHPSLTLKKLQHDFIRFIYYVTKQTPRHSRHGSGYEAGHIISSLPPESRCFTYALELPLSILPGLEPELPNLNTRADAATFVVDSPLLQPNGQRTFDSSMANHISKQFHLVRRYTQVPMIFRVQLPPKHRESHNRTAIEDAYFDMLRFGLRFSPEYVSVDLTCNIQRIKDFLAIKGSIKVIGVLFDSDPGSNGWESPGRRAAFRQAEELGFDLVSLSQQATSSLDNASIQCFAHEVKAPSSPSIQSRPALIAYNTGRMGRVSSWQNATLTPVTHSLIRALPQPTPTLNSLLTVCEAQGALYGSFTLDKMFFGVVGSQVSQSLSPAMHNAGYRSCGMPHEYKAFQHSSLKEMETVFRDHFFGGASISSPFKREITLLVDYMSPDAQAIGAVNTLIPLRGKYTLESLVDRNRAGPIVGFYGECTDWITIYNCVSRNLSPVNTVNVRTVAVVLGAGGMARAAIYAMIRLGVRNILICNRTVKKAEDVAEHFRKWFLRGSPNAVATSTSHSYDDLLSRGSGFQTPRTTDQNLNISVIQSITDEWPANTDLPTMIISTLPGRHFTTKATIDNRVPSSWFANKTGGVIADVRISNAHFLFRNVDKFIACLQSTGNSAFDTSQC